MKAFTEPHIVITALVALTFIGAEVDECNGGNKTETRSDMECDKNSGYYQPKGKITSVTTNDTGACAVLKDDERLVCWRWKACTETGEKK